MDDYARLRHATAHLDAPFALVDLDAFDANALDLVRRAGGKPVRVASKSVRCRALLADVLGRPGFSGVMSFTLREALWLHGHGLRDLLVAVERTGRYHRPVQRAFAAAGFETRLVHPFATKQLRQPADPGNKTDDTDLAAIHRAAVNGFGLAERPLDDLSLRL
ncbi:MAG: transposase, partial [Actinomycetota bacterium]|nr:transposase [Actinomycetota bacterium]